MIPTRRVLMPIIEDGRVVGDMPVDLSEQCLNCANWTGNLQCLAFLDLIPDAIRSGRHDHREPYLDLDTGDEADGGIRFEPLEQPEEA